MKSVILLIAIILNVFFVNAQSNHKMYPPTEDVYVYNLSEHERETIFINGKNVSYSSAKTKGKVKLTTLKYKKEIGDNKNATYELVFSNAPKERYSLIITEEGLIFTKIKSKAKTFQYFNYNYYSLIGSNLVRLKIFTIEDEEVPNAYQGFLINTNTGLVQDLDGELNKSNNTYLLNFEIQEYKATVATFELDFGKDKTSMPKYLNGTWRNSQMKTAEVKLSNLYK